MKKKILIPILILILLIGAVGGTMAWLTDKTEPVTNTFTVGNIDIQLNESEGLDLKMIPGKAITKDPIVTVEAGSEACWLFVEITPSANFADYLSYEIADEWTRLAEEKDRIVYFCAVPAVKANAKFAVLKGNQVLVGEEVTKDDMDKLYNEDGSVNEDSLPTLAFKAYAVQQYGFEDAPYTAWDEVN